MPDQRSLAAQATNLILQHNKDGIPTDYLAQILSTDTNTLHWALYRHDNSHTVGLWPNDRWYARRDYATGPPCPMPDGPEPGITPAAPEPWTAGELETICQALTALADPLHNLTRRDQTFRDLADKAQRHATYAERG